MFVFKKKTNNYELPTFRQKLMKNLKGSENAIN